MIVCRFAVVCNATKRKMETSIRVLVVTALRRLKEEKKRESGGRWVMDDGRNLLYRYQVRGIGRRGKTKALRFSKSPIGAKLDTFFPTKFNIKSEIHFQKGLV